MPALVLERYAVLGGKASSRTRAHYPARYQPDTLYRIHLRVQGDSFTLYVQGELVDYWSDARLRIGRRRFVLLERGAGSRSLDSGVPQRGFGGQVLLAAFLGSVVQERLGIRGTPISGRIGP